MILHFTLTTLFHITFIYLIELKLIISLTLAMFFFPSLLATTVLYFIYNKYPPSPYHTTWEAANTGVYLPETNVLGLFWVPCDWRTVRTPAASWCWRGSAGESWPSYTLPAPLRIPGMPAEITTKYKLHTILYSLNFIFAYFTFCFSTLCITDSILSLLILHFVFHFIHYWL